jgi:hypothetical protein
MKTYETKDFYLSVLLVTEGFNLIDSYKTPQGVYFTFEVLDSDKLDKLIHNFLNYTAMVNMRRFTSAIVRVRKEIEKHKTENI